ncbi:MAG: hypothetical protein DME06_15485 [Candidatus Rokuibacteriota bacterium]|nr:MAG: hypothetical protein DME06_15485 [Candidatus Rokubacteria bacterium]
MSLPTPEPGHGGRPPTSPEKARPGVDDLRRVGRWLHESREMIGRVIPEIVEDRLRQHGRVEAAEESYDRLRHEAASLRNELIQLRVEARALRRQLVEIGASANTAVASLTETVQALEGIQHWQPTPRAAEASQEPPPARSRWRLAALAAAGATAALLAVVALMLQSTPIPPVTPAPGPALPQPAAVPPTTDRPSAPEPPAPPEVARLPDKPLTPLRNEIRHFRVVNVSGHEIQVVIDYAYAGDQGTRDVFIHAAALQEGDELRRRVPGTSFPFAPIRVGNGSATIDITKQSDTGPSVSTRIKICMVSIRTRAAFVCETFPYTKAWDS